jgi:hypothetical protein
MEQAIDIIISGLELLKLGWKLWQVLQLGEVLGWIAWFFLL